MIDSHRPDERKPPSHLAGADTAATFVGIGLKPAHYQQLGRTRQPVDFLEAHAENYFVEDDLHARVLDSLRRDSPVSLHCIGLSLGSATGIREAHLQRLCRLVERVEPFLVSDHVSWGVAGRLVVNELLPLPFTRDALEVVAANVGRVQDRLRRSILIENIAAYMRFKASEMPEAEFLNTLASRTGCRLLLDLTNLHVNQCNHEERAVDVVKGIDPAHVGQYHLAGHLVTADATIDDHGSEVSEASWALYARAIAHAGAQPTVIEWDQDVPPLEVLVGEAAKASRLCTDAKACVP